MARCGDVAIFVTTTDRQQTKPVALPLAHADRVITYFWHERSPCNNLYKVWAYVPLSGSMYKLTTYNL